MWPWGRPRSRSRSRSCGGPAPRQPRTAGPASSLHWRRRPLVGLPSPRRPSPVPVRVVGGRAMATAAAGLSGTQAGRTPPPCRGGAPGAGGAASESDGRPNGVWGGRCAAGDGAVHRPESLPSETDSETFGSAEKTRFSRTGDSFLDCTHFNTPMQMQQHTWRQHERREGSTRERRACRTRAARLVLRGLCRGVRCQRRKKSQHPGITVT